MSGDARIAQGNRETPGFEAFQNDACINDRTVALSPIERIAERLRLGCNVVERPHLPKVSVARQAESKQWILQFFGRKL